MAKNLLKVPFTLLTLENYRLLCPLRIGFEKRKIRIIQEWCDDNLEHNYVLFTDAIYTETDEEAMAFKLRWI